MMHYLKICLALSLCCLLLGACGKRERVRYYLLEATAIAQASEQMQPTAAVIGLGPVDFPDYLRRSQMVLREGTTEVVILDRHKWAEPLEQNFIRVIEQSLAALLPAARIIGYPSRQWSQVQKQVIIDVNRFDSDIYGETVLEAQLTLIVNADPTRLTTSHSRLVLKNQAVEDYAAMADVMAGLAQQLAAQIRDLVSDTQNN